MKPIGGTPCGCDSNSRTVLADGSIRFTFPTMDRQCGDCSIFDPVVTITPGNPAPTFQFSGTLNSSASHDTWHQIMIFRRNDGSDLFTIGPAGWEASKDIASANTPQLWTYSEDDMIDAMKHKIPVNFADAVTVRLNCRC